MNLSKNPYEYICEKCDYKSCNRKDYKRHLLTTKHKMITNDYKPEGTHICKCGKKYKHRQGLSLHKKKCTTFKSSSDNQHISDTNQINDLLTNSPAAAQIAQLTMMFNEQSLTYASQIAMTELRAAKQLEEVESRAAKQVEEIESRTKEMIRQSEAHIAKQINIMVNAVQQIANSR